MPAATGILDAELGPPALGWRPTDPRWRSLLATRILWRLSAPAAAIGGFVSAAADVRLPTMPARRPLVAVVEGEQPGDGLVTLPPVLVVTLAGSALRPGWWLARGVGVVWVLRPDGGGACLSPGRLAVAGQRGVLAHPEHAALRLGLERLIR